MISGSSTGHTGIIAAGVGLTTGTGDTAATAAEIGMNSEGSDGVIVVGDGGGLGVGVDGLRTSTSRGMGPGLRPLALGEEAGESAARFLVLPPPLELTTSTSASSTIMRCNNLFY